MNDIQLQNFVYWLQEHRDLRGLSDSSQVWTKFNKIIELKKEFFDKYPNGILTGWKDEEQSFKV